MNSLHDSWYAASANPLKSFPRLLGDHQADVCVVGGGIAGLSGALHLAEHGLKVILLEAQCIGWGASGRSGGQVIFGYSCDIDEFENTLGEKTADRLWDASLAGVKLVHKLIRKYNIDCDFTPGHAHVAIKPKQMDELKAWQDDLAEYDYDHVTLWDQAEVRRQINSEKYIGALYDSKSGHLHPLNYTRGLAQACDSLGVQIFEQSEVTSVQPGQRVTINTNTGQVKAGFCMLAGNAYMSGILPEMESHIVVEPSYVVATKPLGDTRCRELIPNNIAFEDMNIVLDYCRRSADHRVLFGGQVVAWPWLTSRQLTAKMRRCLLSIFPQLSDVAIDYLWTGDMAYTKSEAPDLGRVGHNLYYAHGFSGHGMAMAGLAGKVIADAINGQVGQFDLFNKITHKSFTGQRTFSQSRFALEIAWYRIRDALF